MLEQLQAFATNGSFNLVPDSLKKGIPLFYLPSTTMPQTSLLLTDSPQLNIQLRFVVYCWNSLRYVSLTLFYNIWIQACTISL
jgi:hypothetical protein